MTKFLRVDTCRHSRLGKTRRKLQKWRRPRGKHNKTRLKRFSYPVQPGIGFGSPKDEFGKILSLKPVFISKLSDIQNISNINIAILSRRLGAKKRLEILKKLSEMNIKVFNAGGKR